MKRAIVSDIHANLEALEAVLEDIRGQGVDEIYCLGDIVSHGPNPRECLEHAMLWSLCLLGGTDAAVRDAPAAIQPPTPGKGYGRASAQPGWNVWTAHRLTLGPAADSERRLRFLSQLAPTVVQDNVLFVHGSPRRPLDEYLFPEDIYNERKMADVFLAVERHCFQGRSHIPGVITHRLEFFTPDDCAGGFRLPREKAIINVGSVGQPRDGDPRACYAIVDAGVVHFRRVEYPFDIVARKMEKLL